MNSFAVAWSDYIHCLEWNAVVNPETWYYTDLKVSKWIPLEGARDHNEAREYIYRQGSHPCYIIAKNTYGAPLQYTLERVD